VTIPPIGAIGSVLSQGVTGLGPGETSGAGAGTGISGSQSANGLGLSAPATGVEQTTGAGASTGVGGIGGVSGSESPPAPGSVEGASGGGESGGFGGALTQAISSLDQTQQSAAGAAQALATGTASNPESAVVTVEDAQLAMQLASQIRTKAVEAAQQIFQTQV
jgi:flagellar hook-basal body complex protein FliE